MKILFLVESLKILTNMQLPMGVVLSFFLATRDSLDIVSSKLQLIWIFWTKKILFCELCKVMIHSLHIYLIMMACANIDRLQQRSMATLSYSTWAVIDSRWSIFFFTSPALFFETEIDKVLQKKYIKKWTSSSSYPEIMALL